ncbi:MAG TPA: ATP-binding cassette domain-containing protein [Candidatus Saccharimonadales bacterium]|jgi:phospholipid/cholesterol/gamma-HCH transport system ATP-binding protein|nr:ATP-binding cassette domain-containing protein [Candidatus Saccharimonadales bacterium]
MSANARMCADASSDPVLSFEDISIGFDMGNILDGLTFSVASRETKILIGESGSGKTLILKLAAGLIQPDSGSVVMLGHDLGRMSEKALLAFRKGIGFVFQEGALFDSLTVAENVAYCLEEDGVREDEIESRVRESLRFVEMEDTLEKYPDELSGGMRRRVSIARALVTRPCVVLYDSPTAGLDPVTSQTIIRLILRLRDTQGVTSLLATHRLQDAFGLANYRFDAETRQVVPVALNGTSAAAAASTNFVVLRDGKAYFEGSPKKLAETSDPYLKRFLL